MNMEVFEVFVFILLLYLSSSSEGRINDQYEIVLENPLENFPLLNMEIDFEANIIYASGKNILYRLSVEKDMKMLKRRTGPEANCLPMLPEGSIYYCGDDYNTVMVVTPDSLITCGTLRGGLCLKRHKESLNISFTSPNIRLVSNDQASAVGIFLNITDTNSKQFENIVLFAKEYTKLPLSAASLDKTAIFSALPDLTAIYIGSSKFGRIFDMIFEKPESVELDYRVAFENEDFVFFLVNQNWQSKLVKICKTIDSTDSKKVYEDIPISCNSAGTNLTHVKHGTFITVSGKRLLVSLFSNSKPNMSAVCIFEENEIYQAFLKSRRHRYGCPNHDLPQKDVIFKDDNSNGKSCVVYSNFTETNEPIAGMYDAFYKGDYCNKVTRAAPQFGIVAGLLPLESKAVYVTKSHRVTVIEGSNIHNLTILYIGTERGSLIQLLYDIEKKETSMLAEFKVDLSEIKAIKRVNEEMYIMSQNKIVKLLPTKNCGQYSGNCQQCMDVQDVDCGWCVTKGGCSTYSDCTSLGNSYWLPSPKNECLSLDLLIDLSRHAYKVEDKVLIMMTPLNNFENMNCHLDGFNVPQYINENVSCRIRPIIVFADGFPSSNVPFEVSISIVAVGLLVILCVSFLSYKWGVRQGQKSKLNQKEHDEDHYHSPNEDTSGENHTYEQPYSSPDPTTMAHEQELTAYTGIM